MNRTTIYCFLLLASTAGAGLTVFVPGWNDYAAILACVAAGIAIAALETMVISSSVTDQRNIFSPRPLNVCLSVGILICGVVFNHFLESPVMKIFNVAACLAALFSALKLANQIESYKDEQS